MVSCSAMKEDRQAYLGSYSGPAGPGSAARNGMYVESLEQSMLVIVERGGHSALHERLGSATVDRIDIFFEVFRK
ncbi:hypothetical protein BN77_2902 [Rhizobium mesoamericanum STM3625]|uniref:Uncharacterized protein n=1 Tax=Rhizobium mesoamericanum STM3625 TaxID=1211777 RepID=K0PVZ2_9HYPH|nr:hypothetical protein BN77_2902 [Rhizobium mesoamericanum STM3625]